MKASSSEALPSVRPTSPASVAQAVSRFWSTVGVLGSVAGVGVGVGRGRSSRGSGGSTFLTGLIEPFVGLGRPGVLGVAIRRLPSRGFPGFAAQRPTTTRPPIRKCEQVAV